MNIFSAERNTKDRPQRSRRVREKLKRKGFTDLNVRRGAGVARNSLKGRSKLHSMSDA